MVWNALSFWDGQPVTSPVYPQMGDLWNPNTTGYQRSHHHHAGHVNHGSHGNHGNYLNRSCYHNQHQNQRMDMGDFRQMSCPMPNYYPQFREPCLHDGEAFCAYNGMDMNQGYNNGAGRPGSGAGTGTGTGGAHGTGSGDFW
ncbi:uncharacterized protein [Drosophila takahashii]|uniref:uncharacterized protein n=1 Tax=Drosophila takahashii TaxID=29030 RepID=UPI001CF8C1EC|nr:uncharacterized protein LOC108056684 [Drosophila takahashii]